MMNYPFWNKNHEESLSQIYMDKSDPCLTIYYSNNNHPTPITNSMPHLGTAV